MASRKKVEKKYNNNNKIYIALYIYKVQKKRNKNKFQSQGVTGRDWKGLGGTGRDCMFFGVRLLPIAPLVESQARHHFLLLLW